MAYKRKRTTKNVVSKRRRAGVKRRVPRYFRPRVPMLTTQRTWWLENWTPNTVSTNGFWRFYSTTLNAVPNNTEFTNLFDQYKIAALKFVFRPRYDNFSGNDTTDTTIPGVTNQAGTLLHVVNDPWSTVIPTGTYQSGTLNSFFEQGNRVKTYNGNKAVSVYFKPTVRNMVASSSANPVRGRWLQDSGIQHYGFHIFAQDVNLTGVFGQSWDVYVTAYMMFKNMK